MKDLAQFRKDLAAWMQTNGVSQKSLALASTVDQAILSRFLKKKDPEGLSGKSVLLLYPYVYGDKRPPAKTQPPADSPQVQP